METVTEFVRLYKRVSGTSGSYESQEAIKTDRQCTERTNCHDWYDQKRIQSFRTRLKSPDHKGPNSQLAIL